MGRRSPSHLLPPASAQHIATTFSFSADYPLAFGRKAYFHAPWKNATPHPEKGTEPQNNSPEDTSFQ
jgi:hypothetical protein